MIVFLNYVVGTVCMAIGAYDIEKGMIGWGIFLCGNAIGNFLTATRRN